MSDASKPTSMPYYQDDWVEIWHADSTEFWGSYKADRLITDPPYGFRLYRTDKSPTSEQLYTLAVTHLTSAVFGYPEDLVAWAGDNGLMPSEWITWWPTNAMRGRDPYLQRESEHILIWGDVPGAKRVLVERSESAKRIAEVESARGKARAGDYRRAGDVWRDPKPGSAFTAHLKRHPNEKPLTLMERLVELCSEPGEIILDPFMGSGTTLEAAKRLGRKAIGIEIEEKWCEVAAQRCSQDVMAVA